MERNIDVFFDKVSTEFHKYLHHQDFEAVVLKDTDKFTRFSIGKELNTRFENETKAWQENHINDIFQRIIMADLIEKFENIHRNLHSIKDDLKGFKTPFDVDNKIGKALASGASGAGVIGSFLMQRVISHPGVVFSIATVGLISGIVFVSLLKLELVDDFDTVRSNAFQARRDVFTTDKIQRILKKEYFDGIQKIIKAFLEGELEKEIMKIKENISTMRNKQGFFQSEKKTLSYLQSTVTKKMESLHQIECMDIKPA